MRLKPGNYLDARENAPPLAFVGPPSPLGAARSGSSRPMQRSVSLTSSYPAASIRAYPRSSAAHACFASFAASVLAPTNPHFVIRNRNGLDLSDVDAIKPPELPLLGFIPTATMFAPEIIQSTCFAHGCRERWTAIASRTATRPVSKTDSLT